MARPGHPNKPKESLQSVCLDAVGSVLLVDEVERTDDVVELKAVGSDPLGIPIDCQIRSM
jgi:hypothetical protein